jgi:hypothetical protein
MGIDMELLVVFVVVVFGILLIFYCLSSRYSPPEAAKPHRLPRQNILPPWSVVGLLDWTGQLSLAGYRVRCWIRKAYRPLTDMVQYNGLSIRILINSLRVNLITSLSVYVLAWFG